MIWQDFTEAPRTGETFFAWDGVTLALARYGYIAFDEFCTMVTDCDDYALAYVGYISLLNADENIDQPEWHFIAFNMDVYLHDGDFAPIKWAHAIKPPVQTNDVDGVVLPFKA